MQSFKANDGVTLRYIDTGGGDEKEGLILIHGFTGSSAVWQKNLPTFSDEYRVIVPDLRGHGESGKAKHGYHVSRLAMDLRELVLHLGEGRRWKAIGGSLGCSVLWCYASLFTPSTFTHLVFVDQSPLQDLAADWPFPYCNRGMNNPGALAGLQTTLALAPALAHQGTIASCLSYRSHPRAKEFSDDAVADAEIRRTITKADEEFFLNEAMRGDQVWFGKLMADHTALDWRDAISACLGPGSGSEVKVLVVASSRSGCFRPEGPMSVVGFVNGAGDREGKRAKGIVIDWGGHWCYWEDPKRFGSLCLGWLRDGEVIGEAAGE